ncbi:hypothetical protein GOB57_22335 [Sinorhizobium meliloti]|nr:hypothetical protein [Sinorhizobium meliloti]
MTHQQTFEEAISAIKHQATQFVLDTIEDNPTAVLGYLKETVDQVFGTLTTNQKFAFMAQVTDTDEIGMNTRYLGEPGDIAQVAEAVFSSCLEHYLAPLRESFAGAVFAVGFLPAASAMIEVAERSGGSKWLPADQVEAIRAAYDRLAASEGGADDLKAVIGGLRLFETLMDSPNDRVLHNRHNTTMEEMTKVTAEVKYYRDLLGPGWPLAPKALELVASRQRNLPIIEAENERKRAVRARLNR